MQDAKLMRHFYLLFEHHCKRKTCPMCEWDSFANPTFFMCAYGKTLVKLYNETLDKVWNERTYYTSGAYPLGDFWKSDTDGSELSYEFRSWRENGMGLIRSIRRAYRQWRNNRRTSRTQ